MTFEEDDLFGKNKQKITGKYRRNNSNSITSLFQLFLKEYLHIYLGELPFVCIEGFGFISCRCSRE